MNFDAIASSLPINAVTEFNGVSWPRIASGKVREIFDLGDALLLVASDRLSAFDVILPDGIPGKGIILNQMSLWWFGQVKGIIENHLLPDQAGEFARRGIRDTDLQMRSMVVRKLKPLTIECVVRGYLAGSGWSSYKNDGTVCGLRLPPGLRQADRLPEPIFTPTTKADEGHDMAISMEQVKTLVGAEPAAQLERLSIALYKRAAGFAQERGIIIADTKFEFGRVDNEIIVIDEVLTPDSSRFWSAERYRPGQGQDSFDKQIVRDYLNTLDWDKTYPGPRLPSQIMEKTAQRYREIFRILTGKTIE